MKKNRTNLLHIDDENYFGGRTTKLKLTIGTARENGNEFNIDDFLRLLPPAAQDRIIVVEDGR